MANKKPSGTKPQIASETDKAEPKVEIKEVAQEVTPAEVAPAPVAPPVRQRRIERQEGRAEPFVHKYPEIRGGVCEWCGILDQTVPSQYQYKLCPHFRGEQMRCSYCPASKDPDEVIGQTILHVFDHPSDSALKVAVCSAYQCNKRHQERFTTSV